MTGKQQQRASRLLVIEDDRRQLRTLTALMREEGFEVVGCSSAGEAHELLGGQEIDVAILDLRLGDLSEAELIGGLRDVAESVPIIVHTAYASYETARDLLNIGAFAYVEKGGDPEELVRCVRNAIEVRLRGRTEDLASAVRERTRDLRRANEALRESEERYRSIFEASGAGIALIDAENGHIEDCNAEYEKLSGRTLEELRKTEVWEIRPPEKREAARAKFLEIRARGNGGSRDAELQRPDGSIVHVDFASRGVTLAGKEYLQSVVLDVTERTRARDALRDSEERYRQVVSSTIDAVMVFDAETRKFIEVNEACTRLYGYSREEFLNMTHSRITAEQDASDDTIEKTLAGKLDSIPVRYHRKKDGSLFPVEITASTFTYLGREVICGVARDITERRAAEEALELRSCVNQMLLDSLPCVALLVRPATREIVASNRAAVQVGAVPGKTCFQTWGQGDSPCPWCLAPELWSTGQPQHLQAEGSGRVWDAHWLPVTDDLYLHYAFDITDRQREEGTRRLQSEIAANMSEGVYLVRAADGVIVYANPKFEEMFGYDPDQMLGKHVSAVNAPTEKSPEETAREIMAFFDEQGCWEGEINNIRKDGTPFWSHASVSAFDHPQHGKVYVAVHTDITDRKRAEEKFLQAQKMEAVGHLAGGVAHDFRNQLTVIRGFAEALLRRSLLADEGREKLTEIIKAVDRSDRLTAQLLAFSRKETLEPEIVDLSDLVADLAKSLPRMIGEDIRLSVTRGPHPCRANVDENLFDQAVVNLVVNARDAMGDGGELIVETDVQDVDPDFAERRPYAKADRYVVVCVQDTGVGMDEETRRHAFEPFFTTKPVGKGTGLGLSMVYGFVQQSGGFVECESRPGQGTRFSLYFPWTAEAVSAVEAVDHDEPPVGGSETILAVEDEEPLRRILAELLREGGYQVLEAAGCSEALALCEKFDGPIDMLVTDVVMPGMNGPDLAQRIQAARPGVPVLYVSGYTGDDLRRRSGESIRGKLLTKPFTRDQLLRRVRETFDSAGRTPHPAGP